MKIFPVHSSKFALGNHAWDDPLVRITAANENTKLRRITPKIGEKVMMNDSLQVFEKWWTRVDEAFSSENLSNVYFRGSNIPLMKRILFIIFTILLNFNALAQREHGSTRVIRTDIFNDFDLNHDRDVTDTLGPVLFEGCDATPMIIFSTNGGYLSGGNGYGDLEKTQFISIADSGTVFSVMALIAAKEEGSNQEFRAFMYSGSLTTGPLTRRDTSFPVAYENIDTTGLFTTFSLQNPQNFNGGFFLSLEVENNGAYIGIAHTNDSCGDGSAWERWNNGVWYPISSPESWGIDISLYIYAEISDLLLDDKNSNLILRGSEKVVPNPTNSSAILIYSLLQPDDITVNIYSLSGQLINSYYPGFQATGLNQLDLKTESLNPGMYIYSIVTGHGVRNGKFSVVR